MPFFTARSITLQIFSACTSPRLPPSTVKSWLNTYRGRPSTVPQPVTTLSPRKYFLSMSKSEVRWVTKASSSRKEPLSRSASIRSRAVILPLACWASMRS